MKDKYQQAIKILDYASDGDSRLGLLIRSSLTIYEIEQLYLLVTWVKFKRIKN